MYTKILRFTIIALLVLCNVADGKKSKKNKRPKVEEDYTTLQPNIVAYSTFGFNDVASYDGFVPTSPDYASFFSGVGQESTTRLYAPAFPSAVESTDFSGNFDSSPFTGQSSGAEDSMGPSGMLHYSPSSMNFFNTPNFGTGNNHNKNVGSENIIQHNIHEPETPVYGTKINSRYKSKSPNPFNITDFNIFSNYSDLDNDNYFGFHDESIHEAKPSYDDLNANFQNNNNYEPTFPSVDLDDFEKSLPNHMHSVVNFPKVVDFTNYYPAEMDTSKFPDYTKFSNTQNTILNAPIDNSFSFNSDNNKFINSKPTYAETFEFKNNEESSEKNVVKQTNSYIDQDYTYNHIMTHNKQNSPNTKNNADLKKKTKHKPWISGNNNNDFKNWKDSSSVKEYGYSNNVSNMHFKFDEMKKPFSSHHDEVEPASSNVVDLTNYQQPETDFTNFKKMPQFNDEEEYPSFPSFKGKLKPTDYFSQFKNSYSTAPTTTSYWGNAFKNSEYSLFGEHEKKPYFNENNNDIVVSIPKRPNKSNTQKPSEYKHLEWPSANHRPHKNKPIRDGTKDFVDTRYKSEEDLLGLRNHDTSHPSYIPTFKHSGDAVESRNEFKKLVEKWRQSYLQSKYKEFSLRDHEGYGTEVKPLHVPLAKPYAIEVPHPVIVPVPRPYPVRVPVSRPVAVPVVHEITVPIVKPVPYPVIKKVPYPVEKLVPVPVEKEVAVPVEKPYPVHIPYFRPVFHHTRPVHEDHETDQGVNEEEEFVRRPEFKKAPQYKKRPYSSRNRSRRPSRTVYQERSRRRWPDRRRPSGQAFDTRSAARPFGYHYSPPYKYHVNEPEEEEDERDAAYCRRTGRC